MKENKDFSTTFLVEITPEEAFDAINNVRGWWSQAVEGDTARLGAEFKYHYQDVHRGTFKITEFVPGKKVVWHVVENYFNFVKDKSEWTGTDIVFEIARRGDKTEIHFTHVGLVPDYECYDVCSNAWGSYIAGSLRNLMTTGKGQPNPIEEVVSQAHQMSNQDYTTSFTVDQSPEEVFAAVNNVRGWWSEEIEGSTDKLGAEFAFHSGDVHRSTQKITEFVPGKKVVWRVLDSQLNFIKDESEWTGTDIIFEIAKEDGRTELRFTRRLGPCHRMLRCVFRRLGLLYQSQFVHLDHPRRGETQSERNGGGGAIDGTVARAFVESWNCANSVMYRLTVIHFCWRSPPFVKSPLP